MALTAEEIRAAVLRHLEAEGLWLAGELAPQLGGFGPLILRARHHGSAPLKTLDPFAPLGGSSLDDVPRAVEGVPGYAMLWSHLELAAGAGEQGLRDLAKRIAPEVRAHLLAHLERRGRATEPEVVRLPPGMNTNVYHPGSNAPRVYRRQDGDLVVQTRVLGPLDPPGTYPLVRWVERCSDATTDVGDLPLVRGRCCRSGSARLNEYPALPLSSGQASTNGLPRDRARCSSRASRPVR